MEQNKRESIWDLVDLKIFIPGFVILFAIVAAGVIAPTAFQTALDGIHLWLMDHFKWFYILVTIVITAFFLFICVSKYGNIKLGGKNAKPSIRMGTWFTMSMTSTIAVGICFYGISGPVNMFMNPPEFMGVEAGTKEAIIPVLKQCFLHYAEPVYLLICTLALVIALVYYNGGRTLRASDTLYPLLGDKCQGIIGTIVNTMVVVALMISATNMGLAAIQLNAGIGTVVGMAETPAFEPFIIIFYTVLTIVLATSGVHKLMGKISDMNALLYAGILLFIVIFGTAGGNRLMGTFFTAMGEFVRDFVPMVTFSDPIYQTGWQNNQTIYYYAWNIAPALVHALFYVSISYGRTLRQFILINCILPSMVTCVWYVFFGGSAMYGILEGSNLYAMMQQFGDGIATFAFLDTLPAGAILKWVFIILAILTFLTFSDGVAFSFPMLFMKKTELDASMTKVPKALNAAVAIFMGALTFILLYVGGYDALNSAMVVLAFPAAILLMFVVISGIKFLTNREKYDITYQEELAEQAEAATPVYK